MNLNYLSSFKDSSTFQISTQLNFNLSIISDDIDIRAYI